MRNFAFAVALGLWFTMTGAALAQIEGPAPGIETEIMDGVDGFLAEGGPEGPGGPEGGPVFEAAVPPPPGAMPMPGPGGPEGLMMAHRGGGGFGFGPGGPGGLPDANLTDEQLEKIYRAKEAFQDKVGAKLLELHSQSRSLRDAMMVEGDLDTKKLQSIQSRINGLTGEIAQLKLEQRIAVMSAFTPEQRKEMRHNFLQRSVGGGCGGGACGRGDRGGRHGGHMRREGHHGEGHGEHGEGHGEGHGDEHKVETK